MTKNTEKFLSLLEKKRERINEQSFAGINKHRQEAVEKFRQLGLPTQKEEDYKYTNIAKVFDTNLGLDLKNLSANLEINTKCENPLTEAYTLHLKNGFLIEDKELMALRTKGIIACSLREASEKHTTLFENYFNKQATKTAHSIVALNTASVQDGLFVYIPKKVHLDKPIQLVNTLHSETDVMINLRNLFIVDEQASGSLVDVVHTDTTKEVVSNTVTEIYAEKTGNLSYYVLQNQKDTHTLLNNLFIDQKRDSKVLSNTISLSAKLIRNNIEVALEEENCENNTYGLYLGHNEEHIDNFSIINHIAPHCTSWEHFKGILDDKATSAFAGRIHVYKDAQITEAYQTNNNLLLSDDAKANTKPQLIIEADDVKCSHGATVGQLDDEALFYLQSRGISYKESYQLMMHAFASEIVDMVAIPELKERIENWIDTKMRGGETCCINCP